MLTHHAVLAAQVGTPVIYLLGLQSSTTGNDGHVLTEIGMQRGAKRWQCIGRGEVPPVIVIGSQVISDRNVINALSSVRRAQSGITPIGPLRFQGKQLLSAHTCQSFVMAATGPDAGSSEEQSGTTLGRNSKDSADMPGSILDSQSESCKKLTPEEHWQWHTPHLRHWHGLWTLWEPLVSQQVAKSYRSVRSLNPEDETREKIIHKNQWYTPTGATEWDWEGGPWNISREQHSLPDGIMHPQSPDHRVLCLSPAGDSVWAQLRFKPNDPKSVVFTEVFFMNGPHARFSVPVGYDAEGKLLVALLLEDALDGPEKPHDDWAGNAWRHETSAISPARDRPEGSFSGKETITSPTLEVTQRSATWQGFPGGVPESEFEHYCVVHLPNGVTVAAPKVPQNGRKFEFVVTWVISAVEIRQITLLYGHDGALKGALGGQYYRRG